MDVKSSDGKVVSCTTSVNIFETILIANTPNSFPGELAWSKDGSNRIAYVWRPGGGGHQIYTVSYPSGIITQVTPYDPYCKHYPEWSPDGNKIAVTYKNKIILVNCSTGIVDTLINKVVSCLSICWDPSGEYLLYDYSPFTYKYNFETKENTQLPFYAFNMCLDPTGKLLAYLGNQKIIIYNLETNQTVKEFPITTDTYLMDWSGDGKYIAIGYDAENKNIHIFDIDNEVELKINVSNFYNVDAEFAWSPDGSILAFPAKESEGSSINIYGIKLK